MDSPEPVATTTPIPDDELVAAFLRGRDVPCPKCGYNRRDGESANCPECNEQLRIYIANPEEQLDHAKVLKSTLILLVTIISVENAYGLASFGLYIYEMWRPGNGTSLYWLDSGIFWHAAYGVIWFVILVLAIRRQRTVKMGRPMDNLRFIAPVAVIFTIHLLLRMYQLVSWYFI